MYHSNYNTVHPTLQVLKRKARGSADRHSQSLDDVRLLPRPLATLPNTSHSYTFGLPDAPDCTKVISYTEKPSFYGRRSTNCLALDLLEDDQLLELIL